MNPLNRSALASAGIGLAFGALLIAGILQLRVSGAQAITVLTAHAIGLAGAIWLAFLTDKLLIRTATVALVTLGILSCLVLWSDFGWSAGGARRWLRFGDLSLQPSELLKPTFVIAAAAVWSRAAGSHGLLLAVGSLLCLGATLIQPDVGTSALLGLAWLPLATGVSKPGRLAPLGLVGALLMSWAMVSYPHVHRRVMAFAFADREPLAEGYQVQQSYRALDHSGWFGTPNEQRTARALLPSAERDFALSAWVEERGFLPTLALFLGLAGALAVFLSSLREFEDIFTLRLVFLATLQLYAQIYFHALSVLGMIPVVGVPFPFLSRGGSSTVATWWLLGLVQRGLFQKMRRRIT